MSNDTQNDSFSSIPESAQYIDESTLIPASEFIMEGESVQKVDIPSVQASSGQDMPKTEAAKSTFGVTEPKKGGNNVVMIAGAVGLVLVAAIGVKVMGDKGSQPAPVGPAQITANVPVAPVAPVAQVAAVAPVVAASEPAPVAAVPEASKTETAAMPAKTETETPASTDVKVVSVAPKENLDELKDGVRVLDTTSKLHTEEIDQLKARLAKLEGQPGKSKVDGQVTTNGTTQVEATKAKPMRHLTAEQREVIEKKRAALAVKKAAAKAEQDRVTGNSKEYEIHAAKDNLVWLRKGGEIKVYSIGDSVPGVGVLTGINSVNRTATAAGRTIR